MHGDLDCFFGLGLRWNYALHDRRESSTMNYEKLKKIYENMPKQFKYLLAPFFQKIVLWNPVYKDSMRQLDEYDKSTEEERAETAFVKLKETLIYAYEHTAYYKRLFDQVGFYPYAMNSSEEIKKIPVMDKNIATAQGNNLLSDENIKFYRSCTSGSCTGKVFEILLDKDSVYKERAFVNHYLSKFGFHPEKTKTLAFWGHNKDADYYYSPMKNEIVVSPFRLFKEEEFDAVWKIVEQFKPEVVAGYPSAIYLFSQLVRKNKKETNFKLVEFYAENYTDEIKKYVEDTLQCVVTATYGHTERQVFAELYEGGYEFNSLYGYTELIPLEDDDGETVYQIICTGFNSRKMPLIRYVTDDVVKFGESGMQILGHTTSEAKVIGKNGARIYKGTLAPHIQPFKKVKLYQFVQHEKGKVFLDLILEEPFTESDFECLNAYYNRKCEGILDIEIRIVDELIMGKRGKYNWLVSYL